MSGVRRWGAILALAGLLAALGLGGAACTPPEAGPAAGSAAAAPTGGGKEPGSQAGNSSAGWGCYTDAAGFSLDLWREWKVSIGGQGVVTACAGEPSAAPCGVLFWPSQRGSFSSADALLDDAVALLTPILGSMMVAGRRQADTPDTAVFTATIPGGRRLVLLAAAGGEGVLVSGLWATPAAYARERPRLLRALGSFKYSPAPGLVGRSARVSLERVQESREGAFSIKAPQGWQVQATVERPYIDASFAITAAQGDRGVCITTLQPPLYAVPNQLLLWAGLFEGSPYNPGGSPTNLEVRRFRTAAEYLEDLLLPELARKWPGIRLTEVRERPDLAEKVIRDALTTRVTAAEATFEEPGGRMRHKCVALTRLIEVKGVGLWQAAVTHFWSPAAEMGLMESLAQAMEASLQVDLGWAQREAEQIRIRTGIISTTGQEIADIINSAFQYQSAVQDRASHAWSHAMLGTVDVYDPETAESWTVPAGCEHYWGRAGQVFGTQTADPPVPDPAFRELLVEEWMRPAGG